MSEPLRVVHYLNQFFAGIGGEERADVGVSMRAGAGRARARAPGRARRRRARRRPPSSAATTTSPSGRRRPSRAIRAKLATLRPDVVVAGPAFGSGRYGLACAAACRGRGRARCPRGDRHASREPGGGGQPAARPHRPDRGVDHGHAARASRASRASPCAWRVAKPLGPAEVEGYIAQGKRRVWDRGRPGYQRALDMLLDKLHGRPFVSEVPFHAPERVHAGRAHRRSRARDASRWSRRAASCEGQSGQAGVGQCHALSPPLGDGARGA